MKKQNKRAHRLLNIFKEHVKNNIKEYLTVAIIFLIGIIIGIIFMNNAGQEQIKQIQEYLGEFVHSLNTDYQIDTNTLLKNAIINNLLIAIILWFIGSTVIGLPIVYLIIALRGFSLGLTISSIMITFPLWKGVLFVICTLLLQNIIFIPCIFALAVSGIKLYKSIIKDKRKENIKLEILRHTMCFICIAAMLILCAFIEVYGSGNLLSLSISCFS